MSIDVKDGIQHDLLLIIVTSLAILFSTGLSGPPRLLGEAPIVIP